jgi:hypothetical protein
MCFGDERIERMYRSERGYGGVLRVVLGVSPARF